MRKNAIYLMICGVLAYSVPAWSAGFQFETEKNGPPESLQSLLEVTPGIVEEKASNFAFEGIREIGISYGMRGGMAWENAKINKLLDEKAVDLDAIYNFQPLMMDGSMMPPVIVESKDTFDRKNPSQVVISDRVFRIEKPAELRAVVPTWREYLIRPDGFDRFNVGGWAPRNAEERAVWEKSVKEGWEQGRTAATEIFDVNLSRLTRDIKGMILYKKLTKRNMASEPILTKSTLGVTGNDNEMNVNESLLIIREPTKLNRNPILWRTQ